MSHPQKTSLLSFIKQADAQTGILNQHLDLLNSNQFLRDEGVIKHFCVYFAGVDVGKKKVLLGHHKKAGLWLFSGGHLDSNESVEESLFREISEEWDVSISEESVLPHFRLSITTINNPKQPHCSHHFDLWHFIDLSSENFHPNMEKVNSEFHEIRWVTIPVALKLSEDENTKATLKWLNEIVFNEN